MGIQAATYHGARFGWFPRKSVATPEDFGRPMLRSRPDRENCDSPPDSPDFEHTAPGGEEKTR